MVGLGGAPGKAGNQVKSKEAATRIEGRIAERLFCKSRRKNCKRLFKIAAKVVKQRKESQET